MSKATLLVLFDGSLNARSAVRYAPAIADLVGADHGTLLTVLTDRDAGDADSAAARVGLGQLAHDELRSIARELTGERVWQIATEVRWGDDVAEEVVRAARETGASLILMGTHGRSGVQRAVLGSVATAVLARAQIPVAVVPPGAAGRAPAIRSALVTTDGSEVAERAFPVAAALSRAGVKLIVLRAVPPSAYSLPAGVGMEGYSAIAPVEELLEGAKAAAQQAADRIGGSAKAESMLGTPGESILECAARDDADVIIIASHGRSGVGRALLGSVTDHVLRHADRPVLVVPARGSPWLETAGQPAGVRGEADRPAARR